MDEPNLILPPYFTIGNRELSNVLMALKSPLSGYLGGIDKAGYFVSRLQDEWCQTFGVTHAIACNSATSGLLAACMAIGIGPGSIVWTTGYSMSATAACAKVLGATIVFIDIETTRFSLDISLCPCPPIGPMPKCIIVTNLFGHPAHLTTIRSWCDSNKVWMIEDNAQAPFATEDGKYAGTIGHIGVFSLNVHKHIQAGEGGVIVSNNDHLARNILGAINHWELAEYNSGEAKQHHQKGIGLNLRMTEPIAAIACAQLAKGPALVRGRVELAEELTDMVRDIPWIQPHVTDYGCRHVYYIWAAIMSDEKRRELFVKGLQAHGFPMKAGYTTPLHKVFGDRIKTHAITELMVDRVEKLIITFEVCSWDPNKQHLKRMREIINEVAGAIG